jgi:catechol 2,3-dioxygenase-like lactoylglutathione lyase family enzyme
MEARLEHVNITVGGADRTAALLERLFGWRVRWAGASMAGGRTVHVGNDAQYLALYTKKESGRAPLAWTKGMPLNHLAVVVDDLEAVERRVMEAGLTPFSHSDYEPGRRFYFLDADNIEFEVVSYGRAAGAAGAEGRSSSPSPSLASR